VPLVAEEIERVFEIGENTLDLKNLDTLQNKGNNNFSANLLEAVIISHEEEIN
jgi:hypothetical protein